MRIRFSEGFAVVLGKTLKFEISILTVTPLGAVVPSGLRGRDVSIDSQLSAEGRN